MSDYIGQVGNNYFSYNSFLHSVQGDLRPDLLDPRTIGKNLFWTTYPGGHNPKKYNGKDDYSYAPSNFVELAAYRHDQHYDKLGVKGIVGLSTSTKAIGADYTYVAENLAAALNPRLSIFQRSKALGLGLGLGAIAAPKTIIL